MELVDYESYTAVCHTESLCRQFVTIRLEFTGLVNFKIIAS